MMIFDKIFVLDSCRSIFIVDQVIIEEVNVFCSYQHVFLDTMGILLNSLGTHLCVKVT